MGSPQPRGDLEVRLLRCVIGEQSVVLENEALVEELRLDQQPEVLEADDVYHFSQELARLGQGITGIALAGNFCLPVVSAQYFQSPRSAAAGVKTINRSGAVAVAPAGPRRFFVFNVPGALGFQFALSMNQVLEVARALPMASLHFEDSHYAGVAVWRGETIPLIDLAFAAKLGSIRQDTRLGRMMIVRNRANRIFALALNGPVRQPSAAAQVYAPDSVSVRPMRGIRGVFRFEGSPLLVPDLDALVE